MKNRIEETFRKLKNEGKKAFIPYITAGDPDLEKTYEALCFFAENGAHIIELGVPFSDPMADGETIQRAMERALKSGTNLRKILALVKRFREKYQTSIVLMGYYNPFYRYGLTDFAKDAADAGVDGILTVDLPPEEAREFVNILKKQKIISVFLAAPTSDESRLLKIKTYACGFLYFVSVTGVTGERDSLSLDIKTQIENSKKFTGLPVVLGFGISSPDIVKKFISHVDGVVVGSALVKRWEKYVSGEDKEDFINFFNIMAKSCNLK